MFQIFKIKVFLVFVVSISFFTFGRSQQWAPILEVKCSQANYGSSCLVNFQNNENNIIISSSLVESYDVTCTAQYPIKWETGLGKTRYQYLVMSRDAENIFDVWTYVYSIRYSFGVSEGSSGTVTCRSVEYPQISSQIHFFAQVGNQFVNSGKTMKVTPQISSKVVPCPANFVNLNPMLEYRKTAQDPYEPMNWQYDPKYGFIAPQNQSMEGEFKCSASNDSVVIQYIPSTNLAANLTEELVLNLQVQRLLCEQRSPLVQADSLVDIRCRDPPTCHLHHKCLLESENCPTFDFKKGIECSDRFPCLQVPQVHPQGISFCMAKYKTTSKSDFHFYGLDKKHYLISKYTNQVNKKDEAAFRMDKGSSILYSDKRVLFYCRGLRFFFTGPVQFAVVYKNKTIAPLPPGTFEPYQEPKIDPDDSDPVEGGVNIDLTEEMEEMFCFFPLHESYYWVNASRKFTVLRPQSPSIDKTNSKNVFYTGDKGGTLNCRSNGTPTPTFQWFQNGSSLPLWGNFQEIEEGSTDIRFITSENESVLQFPEISLNLQGEYECVAANRLGKDNITISVEVKESRISAGITATIALVCAVVVVAVLIACYRVRRKYLDAEKELRDLTEEEIQEFKLGNPEMLQLGHGNTQENVQFMPFKPEYEISDQSLDIDKTRLLGKGAFGMVIRGKYLEEEVAVKTTLPHAEVSYFKALLSELKVMACIGTHANVVRFFGAVTSRIRERIVYVVLELSPFGSLESYLKASRATYVNFLMNDTITKTKVTSDATIQVITTLDLISWSQQIAAGMEYLENKKVIHGDLATRNVLLFDGKVAKITDFGLSRQLYENSIYNKQSKAPLPWRWMALESLRDLVFSAKSDVWSFGVTVWEIFTLAEVPFPGLIWSLEFMQNLESGMRMYKPKYASPEIYSMLLKCWDPDADKRPFFGELFTYFGDLLIHLNKDEKIPNHEVEHGTRNIELA